MGLSALLHLQLILTLNLLSTAHATHHRPLREDHSNQVSTIKEVEDYFAWVQRVKAKSLKLVQSFGSDLLPDSTLKVRVEKIITVNQIEGLGNFQTVQGAVNSVPKGNTQRTIIQIAAGVYEEKVKIPKSKPYITFLGAGMNETKITWSDTASSSNGTFRSATVSVMANGFMARNLAFENSAPAPPPGAVGAQAVALQISGDQSAFYSCAFLGAQDTLYDHRGRHYFKSCWIQGSIDFIFGDGLSFYEECELHTISTTAGSVTAQKRKARTEDTGFSFLNCSVSGAGVVYLGRAWGAFSRVVYIYTYIDDIILPGGWNDWGIPSRDKTSFYGEYKCSGPGANLRNRVAWSHELTDAEAAPFMAISFIDGQSWLAALS